MIVSYRGVDITGAVTVESCVIDSREVGRLPELRIEFDDADGTWGSWGPQPGDEIGVVESGACGTGAMYVSDVRFRRGRALLKALPVRSPGMSGDLTWKSSTMLKAVSQLASRLGLGVGVHGVSDIAFRRMEQRGRRDLEVMAECCALMGCVMDVFDGKLHVASLDWAVSQKPSGTVSIAADSEHSVAASAAVGGCVAHQAKAVAGGACCERVELSASTGKGGRAWEVPGYLAFSSAGQLRQCCKGITAFAAATAPASSAVLDSPVPWTPGSVVMVDSAEVPGACGKALVSRVRCELVSGVSKVWWRSVT